jgi:hypothetical protein
MPTLSALDARSVGQDRVRSAISATFPWQYGIRKYLWRNVLRNHLRARSRQPNELCTPAYWKRLRVLRKRVGATVRVVRLKGCIDARSMRDRLASDVWQSRRACSAFMPTELCARDRATNLQRTFE